MGAKTRKSVVKKSNGIYSIPELRRSFEHIESYVDKKIRLKEPKDKIVNCLTTEWKRVFFKKLTKKSANAFVKERMSHSTPNRTLRKSRGGSHPIAGAPLEYTTRAGVYLEPAQIPNAEGHIGGGFGSYVPYVDKGFWNPMPGHSFDPIQGQQRFPTSTPIGMGNNTLKGGKRRIRRGGSLLDTSSFIENAYRHPYISTSPPNISQNMNRMWYGQPGGTSPDQVQRPVDYKS